MLNLILDSFATSVSGWKAAIALANQGCQTRFEFPEGSPTVYGVDDKKCCAAFKIESIRSDTSLFVRQAEICTSSPKITIATETSSCAIFPGQCKTV
jgi:hypothetical protein